LFFVDVVAQTTGKEPPEMFHWLLHRGVDADLPRSDDAVFVYTLLPKMIFRSGITPERIDGWTGTRIGAQGTIGPPQELTDGLFWDFLVGRIETMNVMYRRMSSRQRERINEAYRSSTRPDSAPWAEAAAADAYWDQFRPPPWERSEHEE
jgi:hypothetical protein